MTPTELTIIGRSSSTFTRVARIFAAELGVPYGFEVVRDLRSLDARDYGGHPALKVPSLRTPLATWFGALNICRQLARVSQRKLGIVWPEAHEQPLLGNMQELVSQAMSTEVQLIMSDLPQEPAETPNRVKTTTSLRNVVSWLDMNVEQAMAALPPARDLSYLEVTLFCLVKHLEFRKVLATSPYPSLTAFCDRFGARTACAETEFRFDA